MNFLTHTEINAGRADEEVWAFEWVSQLVLKDINLRECKEEEESGAGLWLLSPNTQIHIVNK